MPQFNRYVGIDYSGAETADSSCKGSMFTRQSALPPRKRFSLHRADTATGHSEDYST